MANLGITLSNQEQQKMNKNYYIESDGEVFGPFNFAQASEMGLLADTLVCAPDEGIDWQPASKFPEFVAIISKNVTFSDDGSGFSIGEDGTIKRWGNYNSEAKKQEEIDASNARVEEMARQRQKERERQQKVNPPRPIAPQQKKKKKSGWKIFGTIVGIAFILIGFLPIIGGEEVLAGLGIVGLGVFFILLAEYDSDKINSQ